jgi:hypothetical protein
MNSILRDVGKIFNPENPEFLEKAHSP